MIRRRPIARFRVYPEQSLRYTTILDGAVRVYKSGREVCQENAAGYREYTRRVQVMVQRQHFRCCLCNRRLSANNATLNINAAEAWELRSGMTELNCRMERR